MHTSMQRIFIFQVLADASQCPHLTMDPLVCWLFVNDEALPWSDASQYCTLRSGFLAIEHDASLGGKIRQQLQNYDGSREFWLGLRRDSGGSFSWINGSTTPPFYLLFLLQIWVDYLSQRCVRSLKIRRLIYSRPRRKSECHVTNRLARSIN